LADLSLYSPTPAITNSKKNTPMPSAFPVPNEVDRTTSRQETTNTKRIGGFALFDFIGVICAVVAAGLIIIGFVAWKYKSDKQNKKKDPLLPNDSALPVLELCPTLGTETENEATPLPTSPIPRVGYCPPATVDVLMHPLWRDQALLDARIPIEDIQFDIRFASGSYGEVLKGIIKGREIVAIKRLLPEYRKEMACVEMFLKEAKILLSTKHPNIVQMLGVAWSTPSDFCVVCELMTGGDLKTRLMQLDQSNHPVGFDENKLRLAYHIIDALAYLHGIKNSSMGPILHRDLKSKNILLNDRYDTAKLIDFGTSRETNDATTMPAAIGTSLYMAPEVIMGKRYDPKADIFSFGIILTELDTQKCPYFYAKHLTTTLKEQSTVDDMIIIQQVASGRLTASFSPLVNEDIQTLGNACLQLDPSKRPTAAQVRTSLDAILHKPRSTSVTL
jgi:serine/threonine-protein kinase TNNI3K